LSLTNYNQSRTKQFRRCQKQYSFRYDYAEYYPELAGKGTNLEMVPKVHKLPLYRGTWMHALQETLHHQWAGATPFDLTLGEGRNSITSEVSTWQDTQELLTDAFDQLFDEEKEDLGELPSECERLFKSYLRFWKEDRDKYEVASLPNGDPAIELIIQAPLKKFGVVGNFKGKIDLVVLDDEYDGFWIWDGKWVKSIPAPDERMMSPQALLYVWGLREQYDIRVRGFVYNYARTKPPTIPRVLKRPAGMLSTASKMDTDYFTYLSAIKENHGDKWKKYLPYYKPKLGELKGREAMWFDRARIPVEDDRILRGVREYLATVTDIRRRETRRDYVPRTYSNSCKWWCEYHNLCTAEFQGHEIEPLIKSSMQFVGERYTQAEDLLRD
jgi:PD-(D/E)XK nuclease superfamily